MSRSEPTGAASPANRFFEWSAERGDLQYYNKETKENVSVKLPFGFLVLDEVSQVGGGTKVQGKFDGYWSNAVKDLNSQIITVKSKGGIVAQGLYADLKDRKGLHYVKGLYVAYYDDDKTLQIGYIKFKGSSLGAWFEFCKSHRDIYKGAFVIKSKSEVINGDKGDYYTPVFSHKNDITPETESAAIELDKEVQKYFKAYFAHKGTDESPEPAEDFSGPKTAAASVGGFNPAEANAAFNEDADDDDSIPF